MNDPNKEIHYVVYHADETDQTVNAVVQNDSIWVTQKAMADLFGVDRSVITKHISNIYEEEELSQDSTCAKFALVQKEGNRHVRRSLEFYNLDAIISVGYRVNSRKATKFRIWATGVLKEYMIKGFAMDDERLKQGEKVFGRDYFRELLMGRNLTDFFERSLLRHGRTDLPAGFVGGIAAACASQLRTISERFGVRISRILASPMEGLLRYHGL